MGRRVGYSYYIFCSTVRREQAVKFCVMILLGRGAGGIGNILGVGVQDRADRFGGLRETFFLLCFWEPLSVLFHERGASSSLAYPL